MVSTKRPYEKPAIVVLDIVKSCACGAVYTLDQWADLDYVGVQPADAPGEDHLELRQCRCRSTLSLAVGVGVAT